MERRRLAPTDPQRCSSPWSVVLFSSASHRRAPASEEDMIVDDEGSAAMTAAATAMASLLLSSKKSGGGHDDPSSGSGDSYSSSYLTREVDSGRKERIVASKQSHGRQPMPQLRDVREGQQCTPPTKWRSRHRLVVGRRRGGRGRVAGIHHSPPPPRPVLLFLVAVVVTMTRMHGQGSGGGAPGSGSGSGGYYLGCLALSFVGGRRSNPLTTTKAGGLSSASSTTLSLMNRKSGVCSSGEGGRSRVQRFYYRRRDNATDELLASSSSVVATTSSSSVAVSTTTATVIPPPTAGADVGKGGAAAADRLRRQSTTTTPATRRGRRRYGGSRNSDDDSKAVRERLELQYRQLLLSSSTSTTIAVGGQQQQRGSASSAAKEVVAAAATASLARARASESTSSSSRQWSIASPTAARRQSPLSRPRDAAPVFADAVASSRSIDGTLSKINDKKEVDSDDAAAVSRARYLLLVAAALYGTNFSCVKLLLMGQDHALPVGASSTVRFGMAALATAPWLFPHSFKECKLGSSSVAAIVAGLEVGAWNSIGYVAQAIGLETTEASKSAFLCSLAVVVVPILDYLFKNKKMLPKQVVGTTMALVGVAILELGGMLSGGDGAAAASGSASPLLSSGDLASLIQPLAFGLGFWRMEAAMHKYPHQALRSTAAQLFAVFVGSAMYCYGVESAGLPQPTLTLDVVQEWFHEPTILAGLLWTGVVTTALTVYMETMALETLSAAETTLIFSTEPLWGTACAAAVMGEQLGMDAGIGAVLIVVGCLFSNLGWKGLQEHFTFPRMPLVTLPSDGTRGSDTTSSSPTNTFAGSSTLAGGAAATLASVWNNLSVAAKVLAIQAEDLLQDLGFLAER